MADPKLKLGNDIWATKQKSLLAYNDEGGNYKSLPFQVDRISSGTYYGRNGLIQTAASNEPRVDFLNNTKGALLLEPQRTNSLTYSEDFTNWGDVGVTLTPNATIAPNGALTATKFVSTANNWRKSSSFAGGSGTTYTVSVFAKLDTTTSTTTTQIEIYKGASGFAVDFNLSNQTISGTGFTNAFIEEYPNNWFRIGGTYTADGTTQILYLYPSSNYGIGGTMFFWGAQVEAGSYPTSYIPTSGSAVTRVQDVCTQKPPNGILGQSQGILFIDMENFGQVGSNYNSFLKISDTNDSTDRVIIQNSAEANNRIIIVLRANSSTLFQPREDISLGRVKIALKYKSGDIDCFINGVKEHFSSSTFSFANTLNTINIQNPNKVYEVQIFDKVLTDAELATLTTI